ncbi:hypothetical protein [Mycoplasma elephantis]|uniref:hypothetical protein n=1 Tax=Mycoplasma elephantis TaxID=114882 RepID=UPI000484B9A7|nr:hypothetical protein [Mycoplasma elephantis]
MEIRDLIYANVSENPSDYIVEYSLPNEFKAHIYKIIKDKGNNSVKILFYLSKDSTAKTSCIFETPNLVLPILSNDKDWGQYNIELDKYSDISLIMPSEINKYRMLKVLDKQNNIVSDVYATILELNPDDEKGILRFKYYLRSWNNKINKFIRSEVFETSQEGMGKKENKELIEILKHLNIQPKESVRNKVAGINAKPEDLEYKYNGKQALDPSIKISLLEVSGDENSDQVSVKVKVELNDKFVIYIFKNISGFIMI